VELLVVITIIGILVGLLIPAVQSARAAAQKLDCLNNMTNVGKGVIGYETAKGRYPGYVQPVERGAVNSTTKAFVAVSNPSMGSGVFENATYASNANAAMVNRTKLLSRISWAAMILPHIGENAMWDILVDPNASADQSRVIPLAVYICPTDNEILDSPENAGLSYSANAGGWDWNQSGRYIVGSNMGDTADNGLFHNLTDGRVSVRSSNIQDSPATTIMLAENIHKNKLYHWVGVTGQQKGEQQFGIVWVVNNAMTRRGPDLQDMTDQVQFSSDTEPPTDYEETQPWFARPASPHPGGSFNVIFADGHGDSISPEIDYTVYQRLMTPNGRDCVDPMNHTVGSGDIIDQFRRAAPVSEKDYK
jgi:prepilin-type processing-associated H-X9-DG protein